MLSLLRTGRWIGFTSLVVVAIVAFGLLSMWQWSRAEDRRAERTALQARLEAPPLPLPDLLPAGTALSPDLEWRQVIVRGDYTGDQELVRRKPLEGRNGFWVMSALRTEGGELAWILRGWMPVEDRAEAAATAPAVPTGPVTVVGRLRAISPGSPLPVDVPVGQITEVSVEQLRPAADFSAYLELTAAEPPSSLQAVPAPQIDEGRNISYAVQWLLFAAVAMAGWWFFLRREAREDGVVSEPAAVS